MPALPTTCKLNQILDAVVLRLQQQVKPRVGLNLVPSPVTVKRVMRLGDANGLAKPLLAVQGMGWVPEPRAARRFDGILRIAIHCFITAKEHDETELNDLVTDVVRAMQVDETLTTDGKPLVSYCFPVEFTPVLDATAPTGFAQAALVYEANYVWDAETP